MFHQLGTITDTKGNAKPDWLVECVQYSDMSTVVPIFADESSTPIISVSGVANRSKADPRGNYDFFVPSGTYGLKFYDKDGIFQFQQRYLPMYGADATETLRAELADTTGAAMMGTDTGFTVQETLTSLIAGQLPTMDLFIALGQSLTISRAPQITAPAQVVSTLYTFNGGAEYINFNDPDQGVFLGSAPAHPDNFTSLELFTPYAGAESLAAGLGYQSSIDTEASFFFTPGVGGLSARHLRPGNYYFCALSYGLYRAVKLIRAAGYNPRIYVIWSQGHANADQQTDGGVGGETETSSADYITATGKIFGEIHRAVSYALGEVWAGPIWVEPLLTAGSGSPFYTITGRRNINAAQASMQSASVRLLPPMSQFVASCESDGVHPAGQCYRYRGELFGAYVKTTKTPPKMLSKAVVGATVEVTFDQAIALSARVPAGSGLAGMSGFEIYDNTGAAKTISSVVVSGANKIVLTPNNTTNLTGAWYVRNGQHQTTTGIAANIFPRTFVIGTTNVGTAQDGTVLENASIPQEI